jgi:hypothetical protein
MVARLFQKPADAFRVDAPPCEHCNAELSRSRITVENRTPQAKFWMVIPNGWTRETILANTAYCLGVADKYLLGVLNSRLFWFAISNISIPFGIRAGQYRFRLIYQYMEKVPIRVVDHTNAHDEALHLKMIALVDRASEPNRTINSSVLELSELQPVKREIAATDAEIDDLVFKLYDITERDREIVEGTRP